MEHEPRRGLGYAQIPAQFVGGNPILAAADHPDRW